MTIMILQWKASDHYLQCTLLIINENVLWIGKKKKQNMIKHIYELQYHLVSQFFLNFFLSSFFVGKVSICYPEYRRYVLSRVFVRT